MRRARAPVPIAFPAGDGEMATLIRATDWAGSPLGPAGQWPTALRIAVDLMLAARFPILLTWGPEHIALYNDAYRPILGTEKHPGALGAPIRAAFPEIWNELAPMLDGVLSHGESLRREGQLFYLRRNGYLEDCYFDLSFSPIREESGRIGGVFIAGRETTDLVLGQRLRRAELRESDARFRAAFELSAVGMALTGIDGRIQQVNSAFGKMLKYPPAELVGMHIISITHPDDRVTTSAYVNRLLAGGSSTHFLEKRFLDREGHPVWTLLTSALGRDAMDRPAFIISQVLDLTRWRRSDEALALLRRQQEALLDNIPDFAWLKDAESKYLAVNDAFVRAVGKPLGEILGRTDSDLFPPDLAATYLADDRLALERGERMTMEEEFRRADGIFQWIETVRSPFRDATGRIAGIAGIARDVTDRLSAQDTLRESNEALSALIAASPVAIITVDIDGRVQSWNPASERMFGWTEAEVLGEVVPFVPPEKLDEFVQNRERVITGGGLVGARAERRCKDGSSIVVTVSTAPLRSADGRVSGIMAIMQDVTRQDQLESQLRQAQKMEAVGQLTGGIAHDFNNLLTVILANADLLAQGIQGDADLWSDLEDLRGAARRGADLVRKLLAFTRQGPIERRAIDLSKVTNDVSATLRRVLPATIAVRVFAGAGAAPIRADPGAVEQILLNLATNARDAMPSGGFLTLEVATARLDEEYRNVHGWGTPGTYACLSVGDTGIGMDPATRDRVFEPFFTTKPPGEGTGLGLSMAYGLMKQHDGFISVYSEPGQGTTIRLYFPLYTSVEPGLPERVLLTEHRGGGETILIAEDEEVILRSARKILERYGYRVLVAADGAEALRVLQDPASRVDLLISDVVMPKMGGRQLLDAIRAQGIAVKVMLSSGYTAPDVRERIALEAPMPFLNKPWTLSDLLTMVREVLDSEGARS